MFAVMTFERDPMRLQDVPGDLLYWVQTAGGWAAFGVLLWLLLGYTRMRAVDRARVPPWQRRVFLAGLGLALIGYLLAGAGALLGLLAPGLSYARTFTFICLTAGGAGALLCVGTPFVAGLVKLRFRRVWALARLSFKESIRNRVVYAFSGLLLVFLFASWFIPHKPEHQVRTYVTVVYWAMTKLLLVTAVILAAFSIPNDIRHQTIHTIVTKPVERFEIFLGRFLGFVGLMTLVLLLMTTVSVVYVLRGVDPEAAAESLKAREPLYGALHFENTGDAQRGTNVGREWDYRSYITFSTSGQPAQYAVWDFESVPAALAGGKAARCEFAFDIFRQTKGLENRGIPCVFEFQTANFDRSRKDAYGTERSRLLGPGGQAAAAEVDDRLAEEYGYYTASRDVVDYHTQFVDVPAGLLRNARRGAPEGAPALQVRVHVARGLEPQYVGMARYDLYWRLDDAQGGGEARAFTFNFYKGALGLWMRLCLVIGLSVALSTYLSGVISMLVAGVLYLGGGAIDYVQSIGHGTAPGGGPMEALVRLANRQIALIPLEQSPTATVAGGADTVFRWFIRRVLDLLPDVDRYDLTAWVGEGFNIPALQLWLDLGRMVLFLLPWFVLAYYLIKWREIAAPT